MYSTHTGSSSSYRVYLHITAVLLTDRKRPESKVSLGYGAKQRGQIEMALWGKKAGGRAAEDGAQL